MVSTQPTASPAPFALFLIIGIVGMIICMILVGKRYEMPPVKVIIAAVYMTITGVFATYLLAFLESGAWGGRSFFGAAFLVPVFMYPASKVLRLNYADLMDICAPAGCIMLSLLKIKCAIDGCCYGRWVQFLGETFRFPSQIVESIFALVLMIILLILIVRGNHRGTIYAWCLFLYGIMRSILNLLRETTPWLGPLPQGNVWALLAIIIGATIILRRKKKAGTAS